MKKFICLSLIVVFFLFLESCNEGNSKSKTVEETGYKAWIGDTPNPEANIKVVSDYMKAIEAGDLEKMDSLLAVNYKEYGPSPNDSITKEKTISDWETSFNTYENRKIEFVNTSFRVLQGELQGDYVSVWGTYRFTINDKNIKLPFQFTAKVNNGKMESSVIYYDNWYILQTLGYKLAPLEN